MVSFEEFSKQFDITKPAEYTEMLKQYRGYMERLEDEYHRMWTFCGGCYKTVRFDKAIRKIELCGDVDKMVTRCPECHMPWFIREVES